jgi:hypothetical protein
MDKSLTIPDNIRGILFDLAQIRMLLLENAPQCLPVVAPAMIDAEQRVNAIWQS